MKTWIFVGISLSIFSFIMYLASRPDNRKIEHVSIKTELKGIVKGIDNGRGLKVRFFEDLIYYLIVAEDNPDYKYNPTGSYIHSFIHYGDSIYKDSGSTKIYIIRGDSTYEWEIITKEISEDKY
ncbi:MAG: hypothetical protein R3B93_23850 [Bacteroidia bacterium]